MRTWENYKKTFPQAPDPWDLARCGDLRELANYLQQYPHTNWDTHNHKGYTPLMLAVYRGHADFCEALLRMGIPVDTPDFLGNTPLMAASYKGDPDLVRLLLHHGAKGSLENHSGMNALNWAQTFGRTLVIPILQAQKNGVGKSRPRWKNILLLMRLMLVHAMRRKTRTT